MRKLLLPPHGSDVRRMVAFLMLAVGVPRLGFADLFLRFATLNLLPTQVYGVAFTVLGILLLATLPRRLVWQGRIVAVFAFGGYVTLIVDSISTSTVSALVGCVIAYALWGEIISHHD